MLIQELQELFVVHVVVESPVGNAPTAALQSKKSPRDRAMVRQGRDEGKSIASCTKNGKQQRAARGEYAIEFGVPRFGILAGEIGLLEFKKTIKVLMPSVNVDALRNPPRPERGIDTVGGFEGHV